MHRSLTHTKHLSRGNAPGIFETDLISQVFHCAEALALRDGPSLARFMKPCDQRDFLFIRGKKIGIICLSRDSYLPTPMRDYPKWLDYIRAPDEDDFSRSFPGLVTGAELVTWPPLLEALRSQEHFKDPVCIGLPARLRAGPGTPEALREAAFIEEAGRPIVAHERIFHEQFLDMQKPKKIFLSHKSPDKSLVREVSATLRAVGLDPWLDEDAMKAGAHLERGLLQGFHDSCAVVFFLTPNFVDEKYLATEIDYAIAEKRSKGDRFAIISLQIPDDAGLVGEVPQLLRSYVYRKLSSIEVVRNIVEALPLRCGAPVWRDGVQ